MIDGAICGCCADSMYMMHYISDELSNTDYRCSLHCICCMFSLVSQTSPAPLRFHTIDHKNICILLGGQELNVLLS